MAARKKQDFSRQKQNRPTAGKNPVETTPGEK
jgi:hypothetical protein